MGWSGVRGMSGVDSRLDDGEMSGPREVLATAGHCIVDCMLKVQDVTLTCKRDGKQKCVFCEGRDVVVEVVPSHVII
jgi:hypothetical protein